MSKNREIARILYEIAEILELKGVAFKPRAYGRAAQNIEAHGEDVERLLREDRLDEIPGVGASIAEKIQEYVETGHLKTLDRLRKEVPPGVLAIMRVPGVGPKKAMKLQEALKVKDVEGLRRAAEAGKVREVDGFGEKSEQEILKSIGRKASMLDRFPFVTGLEAAGEMIRLLEATGKTKRVVVAGSLRRARDTIGDVDLLVAANRKDAEAVAKAFVGAKAVQDVVAHGATKSSVRLSSGLQMDLRVLESRQFGAALLYFTGSKEHNVALRTRAQKKGWTLNEYALARKKDGKVLASGSEEEIYGKLGLAYIAPELRENRGEIEAAEKGKLPKLVAAEDLKADLHTHTTESDGYGTAQEMVQAAKKLGYALYGISDHSAGLGIANGLDGPRFAKQRKALAKLQERTKGIEILQGSEVNIKKSGELDLTAKVRAGLDYVVGSVHSSFNLEKKEQTKRVLAAIEQGIDVLGHPNGRLIGERSPIELDHDKVFEACAEAGVLVEINGQPERLDLWGDLVRAAKEAGCRFAIDSDAHTVQSLRYVEYGVLQARRGWLEAKDVATTYAPKELARHLGHAKKD